MWGWPEWGEITRRNMRVFYAAEVRLGKGEFAASLEATLVSETWGTRTRINANRVILARQNDDSVVKSLTMGIAVCWVRGIRRCCWK